MKLRTRLMNLLASLALAATVNTAHATEILFAQVAHGGYEANATELMGYLGGISGVNVTNAFLDTQSLGSMNLSAFDQIWVYDLSSAADNSSLQMQNYNAIANWYQQYTPEIIADGRIVASTSQWTSMANGTHQSEAAWIQNYATQLDLHGRGLVLGTDHATAFTNGINYINRAIGVSDFSSFNYESPYRSEVSTSSALFIDGLVACGAGANFTPDDVCINDNSSSSIAPSNYQANGRLFRPVAYVNGDETRVTVATTMQYRLEPPAPAEVPEPGSLALFGFALASLRFLRRRQA